MIFCLPIVQSIQRVAIAAVLYSLPLTADSMPAPCGEGDPVAYEFGECEVLRSSYYAVALDQLKLRMAESPEVSEEVDMILDEAFQILHQPLIRRADSLEELRNPGNQRSGHVDPRTENITKIDPRKAELFALAEADKAACQTLADELPLLAAAYRLTKNPLLLERIIAQLEEFVGWDPIQRPGWSLHNGTNSLPADGNDGVWLATGLGLSALSQTVQILPPGSLPAPLMDNVYMQLDREIKRSEQDWDNRVGWFMRDKATTSNQWIVPSSGLLSATIIAGPEIYPEAYALAISNLEQSLSSLGADGASSEGVAYAIDVTAPYLYLAAIESSFQGDQRLGGHPFLKNFPTWLVLTLQPGESMVNAFDGWLSTRGIYHVLNGRITRLAALSGSPELEWICQNKMPGPSCDLYGLLLLNGAGDDLPEPSRYGDYDRARWVVWRSSWDEDASGVWVRGGHSLDLHDHNDRGHVNFIASGTPLLIESGTPSYGHPQKASRYDSVVGHNVLQVGNDISPKRSVAPITVARLDDLGGDITVEAGAGYVGVEFWKRHVCWDKYTLTVTDEVVLTQPDFVLFRWHLASRQKPEISADASGGGTYAEVHLPAGEIIYPGWLGPLPDGDGWIPTAEDILQTPSAIITIRSDQPLVAFTAEGVDHTMKYRMQDNPHTLLIVRSSQQVNRIEIVTTFVSPAVSVNSNQ
jgi:hypothetical protein